MQPETTPRKAVFFDKDGTLVENVPYSVDPDRLQFAKGAEAALRALEAAGYLLVIVTNQSGVARGCFTEEDLIPIMERLGLMFERTGVELLDFYYCPHHPDGAVRDYAIYCLCRKPEPGLIRRAAVEHGIDLSASWLIGDILDDIEAGHRAGCRTILINNGNETEWVVTDRRTPDFMVNDLIEAALVVVSNGSLSCPHIPDAGEVHDE